MKEKIKERLEEKIELILNKSAEDMTIEEFNILSSKLSKMEFDESKKEKSEEYAKLMTALFNN